MAKASRNLMLIEWEDSAQPLPAWRFLDDAPPLEAVKCMSVGWEVGRANGVLMLAPNLGDASSGSPQASGFIRIPESCIKRRVRLRECKP
jgi:hypothetical protein